MNSSSSPNHPFCLLFALLFLIGCSVDDPEDKNTSHRNDLALGASAKDFLSDEKFSALEVEIVYVTGFEPTSQTLSSLTTFLNKYLNKPGGITVKTRAIPSPEVGTYSIQEILSVEKEHRTVYSEGPKLGSFIFFADEKSEESSIERKIIGKAYLNTSMIVFDKEVTEMSGSISRSDIQITALHHEFGHLFGLVNNGSPAQSPHEDSDPKKRAHCNVGGCLMAAAIEFKAAAQSLVDGENQVLDFDEKCRLDLKANGGK